MLERNDFFLSGLVAIVLGAGCAADRTTPDARGAGFGGSTTGGGSFADAGGSDAPICAYAQIICEGATAKVCDGHGGFIQEISCTECKDGLGCVNCKPNEGVCSKETGLATVCDSTGLQTINFPCDGPGMQCDPDGCHQQCSPTTLGTTNVGCEFWPTITANGVWSGGFHFGVLLANVSQEVATVTISGASDPKTIVLGAGEVRSVPLDWVDDLKGSDWQTPYQPTSPATSVKVAGGAYHVVSNQPLVAYQFSPIEGYVNDAAACPALPGNPSHCYSYSSDASLLLPAHTFWLNHVVTGFHAWHEASFPPPSGTGKLDMGDFLAITATQPSTVTLSLRPNQSVLGWPDLPHPAPGQSIAVGMSPGQVLQIFSPGTSDDDSLSGDEVTSDRPIQLISGMGCASIPNDPTHCSHVEDPVLPMEALGKDYVVPVMSGASGTKYAHTIRVQSISDKTAITFEPTMLTGVTLNRGEVVEVDNVTVDVRISSTAPFAVTQFVNGRSKAVPDGLNVGGPNQVTVPPVSQFRTSYSFAASPDYDASFVSIVAPTGAMVSLDGKAVPSASFLPVGGSGMSVARVALTDNDKVHSLTSDKAVGVVVYGFTPYASYAYAGGLDLNRAAPVARDAGQ